MRGCKLEWDALMEAAEPRIELSATPSEDCAISADAEPPVFATMRGGVPARMMMEGPAGSGHFVSLDLAIGTDDHLRYGCLMGSTVGWRQMYEVGDQLAPLPWLEDVDRDGTAELVVWQRLPWGSSEVDNALFPVVYVLDGNALVRRDDRARSLFTRLAAAYRTRAKQAQPGDPTACFNAVAAFLETP